MESWAVAAIQRETAYKTEYRNGFALGQISLIDELLEMDYAFLAGESEENNEST